MLRLLPLLLVAAGASAQTYSGALAPGDTTLGSGEYVDEYVVEAQRGETVRAVVTSEAFDTYVIVKTASGAQAEDDDCTDGETTRSCAELAADADGPVRVLVTSFRPGEAGAYRVALDVGRDLEPMVSAGGRALTDDDRRLQTGEFYDAYRVPMAAGQRRTVEVAASAFDAYLIVEGPGGVRAENDDCVAGDAGRSCVVVESDEAGDWEVIVTSARPGETGAYELTVSDAPADAPLTRRN